MKWLWEHAGFPCNSLVWKISWYQTSSRDIRYKNNHLLQKGPSIHSEQIKITTIKGFIRTNDLSICMQLSRKRPSVETLLGHHHQNPLYTTVYFTYQVPILCLDNNTNLKCLMAVIGTIYWCILILTIVTQNLKQTDTGTWLKESLIDQQPEPIIGGFTLLILINMSGHQQLLW